MYGIAAEFPHGILNFGGVFDCVIAFALSHNINNIAISNSLFILSPCFYSCKILTAIPVGAGSAPENCTIAISCGVKMKLKVSVMFMFR